MISRFRTFIAGFLVLLPLAVTVTVIVWVGAFIYAYLGPVSAIGRMRTLLGTYFDGDASKLALLLDPTRQNSPMHQFRAEVASGFERLHERLTAIEAQLQQMR